MISSIKNEVDLEVMAIKEYSTFSKAPELEPHHQMQLTVIFSTLVSGFFYPSAEMQSVYSTATVDWATVQFTINR